MSRSETERAFATIEEAIEDIRQGKMVVVCDDEDRENEGDLTLAAQFATPEAINFMAKEGRGLICLALTPDRCDELDLDLMAAKNESPFETAFTVSVEAREGVTTGISAHDRAHTIQVAIDPQTRPRDLVQPGHVFPLKARPGGVLPHPNAGAPPFRKHALTLTRSVRRRSCGLGLGLPPEQPSDDGASGGFRPGSRFESQGVASPIDPRRRANHDIRPSRKPLRREERRAPPPRASRDPARRG